MSNIKQAAFTVIGGVIGWFTMGGPTGAARGAMYGYTVGSMAFPADLPPVYGPQLGESRTQNSALGLDMPKLKGTGRMAGNLLWQGPETRHAHTSSQGGKGGPSQDATTYTYTQSFAISFGEGELEGFTQIFADGILIADLGTATDAADFAERLAASNQIKATWYRGTSTQMPDSTIEGIEGEGNAPAYRDQAYIVFEDFDKTEYGRIPIFEVVAVERFGEVSQAYQSAVEIPNPPADFTWLYWDASVEWLDDEHYVMVAPAGSQSGISQPDTLVQVILFKRTGVVSAVIDSATCVYTGNEEAYPKSMGVIKAGEVINGYGTVGGLGLVMVSRVPVGSGYTDRAIYDMFQANTTGLTKLTGASYDANVGQWVRNGWCSSADDMCASIVANNYSGWWGIYKAERNYGCMVIDGYMITINKAAPNLENYRISSWYYGTWTDPEFAAWVADSDTFHNAPLYRLSFSAEGLGWILNDSRVESSTIGSSTGYEPYVAKKCAAWPNYLFVGTYNGTEDAIRIYDCTGGTITLKLYVGSTAQYGGVAIPNLRSNYISVSPNGKYIVSSCQHNINDTQGIWVGEYDDNAGTITELAYNTTYADRHNGLLFLSNEYFITKTSNNRISPALYHFDNTTHEITRISAAGQTTTSADNCWDVSPAGFLICQDMINAYPSSKYKMGLWLYDLYNSAMVDLAELFTELCQESNLTTADINTAQVTDTGHGYIRPRKMTARAAMEPLLIAFGYDVCEQDDKLVFVPHGGDPVATITEGELGAHEYGSEDFNPFPLVRKQETELPCKVIVNYIDAGRDYQTNSQEDSRQVTDSKHIVTIDLPIAFDNGDKPKQIAQIIMSRAWTTRNSRAIKIGPKYSMHTPTDVFNINMDNGDTHRIKVLNMMRGANGILACATVHEEASSYSSSVVAVDGDWNTQTLKALPAISLYLLDLPILRDQDNSAGLYYAVNANNENFRGVSLFRSIDDTEFDVVDSHDAQATIGTCSTALADGPTTIIDRGNTVTVTLTTIDATLSSITDTQLLAGGNPAIIGAHGRWELIQYKTATLIAPSTYTLSGLIRGKQGTEHNTANHTADDTFIVLDSSTIKRLDMSSDQIGTEYYYRAVPWGEIVDDVGSSAFAMTGEVLMPFSPVHIKGTRDASGNLTITFVRRSRFGNDWNDYTDVPLNEAFERYDVDVMSDDTPSATVMRTITVSSEEADYSAVDQTTDFGSTQSSLTVRVYQISATVGRGHKGDATI